jgi:hypothetical protein
MRKVDLLMKQALTVSCVVSHYILFFIRVLNNEASTPFHLKQILGLLRDSD